MKKSWRFVIVMLIIIPFSTLFWGIPNAIASDKPHNIGQKQTPRFGKESENCNHLLVKLHQDDLPTLQCLDTYITSFSSNSAPSPSNCPGALALFEHAQDQGANICFSGTGNADLTSFCMPLSYGGCLAGTWNDRASSYIASTHAVLYYSTGQRDGAYPELNAGSSGDLTGTWNDAVSSVHVGPGYK